MRFNSPGLLLTLRDRGAQARKNPAWLKMGFGLYRYAAVRPALYRLGGRLSGRGTRILGKNGWINKLPGPLAGWTEYRDFPAFAEKSFSQRWKEERG